MSGVGLVDEVVLVSDLDVVKVVDSSIFLVVLLIGEVVAISTEGVLDLRFLLGLFVVGFTVVEIKESQGSPGGCSQEQEQLHFGAGHTLPLFS